MRIIVDKMPNTPIDCPHSMWSKKDDRIIRVCVYNKKSTVFAAECSDTHECPYFADLAVSQCKTK